MTNRRPHPRPGSWAGWRMLASLALLLLVGGCRYVDTMLDPPEPTVDPRYAFPAFAAIGEPMLSLDAVPEGWDFPPCDGWHDEASGRLRLGNALTAQMPPGPGWVRGEAGSATILVRYPDHSSVPTAFLYMEALGADDPGFALRQFLGRVDRRLAISRPKASTLARGEPMSARGGGLSRGEGGDQPEANEGEDTDSTPVPVVPSPVDPDSTVSQQVSPLSKRRVSLDDVATGPQVDGNDDFAAVDDTPNAEIFEIGFESEKRGFSGWRWIGACGAGQLDEETASAEATTSSQAAALPDANRSPAALATSTAVKPFLRLGRSAGAWRRQANAQPVPALLLVATATFPHRPRYGAHIALVCAQTPECTDAPALARLLGSIRGTHLGGRESSGQLIEPLVGLASEVGVSLVEEPRQPLVITEGPARAEEGE